METKINLNTIILLLILLVFVVGTIVALASIRRLTQPLEEAEQAFEQKLDQLTNPNPTPTIIPDPVTIIREVRSLSRLETASYTVEKVITAESGQGAFSFLFGDRLILVAHGQVIGGVDLGKMSEDDIVIEEDGSVTITLPPAEILVVTLNNQKSYIFNRDTGLVGMNPALETAARVAAEEEILNAALEDGILEIARQNAEVYVLKLLLALGFHDISFGEVSTPTPTPLP